MNSPIPIIQLQQLPNHVQSDASSVTYPFEIYFEANTMHHIISHAYSNFKACFSLKTADL